MQLCGRAQAAKALSPHECVAERRPRPHEVRRRNGQALESGEGGGADVGVDQCDGQHTQTLRACDKREPQDRLTLDRLGLVTQVLVDPARQGGVDAERRAGESGVQIRNGRATGEGPQGLLLEVREVSDHSDRPELATVAGEQVGKFVRPGRPGVDGKVVQRR